MAKYLVIGESVAGIAAAMEVARAGQTVQIVTDLVSVPLEDRFLVGPTPLNPISLRGEAFASLAWAELARLEGRSGQAWERDPHLAPEAIRIDAGTGEVVFAARPPYYPECRFRAVVFASDGTSPTLPQPLHHGSHAGEGLSPGLRSHPRRVNSLTGRRRTGADTRPICRTHRVPVAVEES